VKAIRTLFLTDSTSSPTALPWRDVKENITQIAHGNEESLNEINRVTDDQINKINTEELDRMKPKLEPFCKFNRIKKAISINQNDFYGQCKSEEYKQG
jgi:hypothetical protein